VCLTRVPLAVGELSHSGSDCTRKIHRGRLSAASSHSIDYTQRLHPHSRMLGIRNGDRCPAAHRLERRRRRWLVGEPRQRFILCWDNAKHNCQCLVRSVVDAFQRLSLRHGGWRQLRRVPLPGTLRAALCHHAGRLHPGLLWPLTPFPWRTRRLWYL